MGPLAVVDPQPGVGHRSQFGHRFEQVRVEHFRPIAPVETFDVRILIGLAGLEASGARLFRLAWPAARNRSRHCEARAAVIPTARDTDSRSSPRNRRSTTSRFRPTVGNSDLAGHIV